MNHYCPKCFNSSIHIADKGVSQVVINNLKMDRGQFLFNIPKESPQEIEQRILTKLEEFFKWYKNFQNREPIKYVQLSSADFICERGCKLPMNSQYSIVGSLINEIKLHKFLAEMGQKYSMDIRLKNDKEEEKDDIKLKF